MVSREYMVLGIEAGDYRLLDDDVEPVLFDPACFEVIDPMEPAFWVSEFGEEGERYAYPPGWGVPGFFEGWHDRVEVVRRATRPLVSRRRGCRLNSRRSGPIVQDTIQKIMEST